MEGPDQPSQTQNGNMEAMKGPGGYKRRTAPSISALLADESVDHIGRPISVEYTKLWRTKASANRDKLGFLSEDDLHAIRQVISPAAMNWENENGTVYHHDQSPIADGNIGLEGAKIVPIRLNLGEGQSIHSDAGDTALRNNDFTPTYKKAMEPWFKARDFKRWRVYDTRHRPKISYPSHYIVWQSYEGNALYAQIPKPLEGVSRAPSCDHCRIHDPERAGDKVDYMDDRPHVDGIREMRAVDTAITPFSVCWFHWWYIWSGELLRVSHVHALEMLVSGGLRERWGISHTREFLHCMRCYSSPREELDDDDRSRMDELLPLNRIEGAVPPSAKNSSLPNTRQATVASTGAQPTVPGGRQAGTATADGGPNDTRPSHQSIGGREANRPGEHASVNRRGPTEAMRQEVFGLAARVRARHSEIQPQLPDEGLATFAVPSNAQEAGGPASQNTNGGSQTMGGNHNPPSFTSSAPAPESHDGGPVGPAGPPRVNGQSTPLWSYASVAGADAGAQSPFEANGLAALNPFTADTQQQTNGGPASQANDFAASNSFAPGPRPQTNGTPAKREDGLLYEPPKEPRAMRKGNHDNKGQATQSVIRSARVKPVSRVNPPQGNEQRYHQSSQWKV